MASKNSTAPVFTMLLVQLAVCAITVALFFAVVGAEDRGFWFYAVLIILCFTDAMFIYFGPPRASTAKR